MVLLLDRCIWTPANKMIPRSTLWVVQHTATIRKTAACILCKWAAKRRPLYIFPIENVSSCPPVQTTACAPWHHVQWVYTVLCWVNVVCPHILLLLVWIPTRPRRKPRLLLTLKNKHQYWIAGNCTRRKFRHLLSLVKISFANFAPMLIHTCGGCGDLYRIGKNEIFMQHIGSWPWLKILPWKYLTITAQRVANDSKKPLVFMSTWHGYLK